jgi:hypothetical protein
LNEASSSSLPASSSSLPEKTEILYGNDNIQRVVLEAYSQIKNNMIHVWIIQRLLWLLQLMQYGLAYLILKKEGLKLDV